MGIQLTDQTLAFLQACLLGVTLAVLYDVFRILRVAIPTRPTVVFIQDVVYFFLCAVSTFLFLLSSIGGMVRVFLIIGEVLGWVLYYFTLGQLVMKVSVALINLIKGIIGFLFRYLFYPIWRLIYNIISLIFRPVRFLGQIIKKSSQKLKFRLKLRRIVLYNHIIGYFAKKVPAKRPRENQADGREAEEP